MFFLLQNPPLPPSFSIPKVTAKIIENTDYFGMIINAMLNQASYLNGTKCLLGYADTFCFFNVKIHGETQTE